MRTLVIVCLLGLSAGRVVADDSTSEASLIRAKLRSGVPSEVAWGLHDAIEARLPGLDALVLDVLDRATAGDSENDRLLLPGAIDAILELDIPLDVDRVQAVAPHLSAERTLILAGRDPGTFRGLLRPLLTAYGDDDIWTGACNLLTSIRDPVATAHLVGRLELTAHVTAHDPGAKPTSGSRRTSFATGCGCAQVPPPEEDGWPPRSSWVIRSSPDGGGRLVAPGREPIYAERRQLVVGDFVCSSMSRAWRRDDRAVQFVADLLGWPRDRMQHPLTAFRSVAFTDMAAWEKAIQELRRALTGAWLNVLVACYRQRLLTPVALLTLPPRIRFEVRDVRAVKEPSLPTVLPCRGEVR